MKARILLLWILCCFGAGRSFGAARAAVPVQSHTNQEALLPGATALLPTDDSAPHRPRFRFFTPRAPRPAESVSEKGTGWGIVAAVLGVVSIGVALVGTAASAALLLGTGSLLAGAVALNRRRRLQGVAIVGVLLGVAGVALAVLRGGFPSL